MAGELLSTAVRSSAIFHLFSPTVRGLCLVSAGDVPVAGATGSAVCRGSAPSVSCGTAPSPARRGLRCLRPEGSERSRGRRNGRRNAPSAPTVAAAAAAGVQGWRHAEPKVVAQCHLDSGSASPPLWDSAKQGLKHAEIKAAFCKLTFS